MYVCMKCVQWAKWSSLLSFTCHLTHKNIFHLTHVDKYTVFIFVITIKHTEHNFVLCFVVLINLKSNQKSEKPNKSVSVTRVLLNIAFTFSAYIFQLFGNG